MSSGNRTSRSASGPRPRRRAEPDDPSASTREPFGTRLPPHLIKEVKVAAAVREMDIQEIVEAALRAWLDQ